MSNSRISRNNTPYLTGLVLAMSLSSVVQAQTTIVKATAATSAATATATKAATGAVAAVAVTTATKATATTTSTTSIWGNYTRPFSADSLWNSRPNSPVLDTTFTIPKSSYYPSITPGAYSTGMYLAKTTDAAMTITGLTTNGVWDPDEERYKSSVTLPRWPADALPASGSDGHCDIVDPVTGIIHSFWKLRQVNGKWVAQQYAWTKLNGTGWGDPSHYFQGARAAGVPTSAGLIRKHEVEDGDTVYRHALAMSLTMTGLAPSPAYVFPATSADTGAATRNTGKIPEGARVMLPATYDTTKIVDPQLRKVADTLKMYGAYVVDMNTGTPFSIYVENGANFDLHKGGWNNANAAELDRIRANLRMVKSSDGYINGDSKVIRPTTNLNPLSMRGTWTRKAGTATGPFETLAQAVVFPATTTAIVQTNSSSRVLGSVDWSSRRVGSTQALTAVTTGGGKLRLQINVAGKTVFDSGDLTNNQSVRFVWPANATTVLTTTSGTPGPSTVAGSLVEVGL
ncbi:MAG: Atrophin-1 multi-domain protein [Duganella sp.]